MLDLQRDNKLIEAITYFVANTKNCGLTKLFKLLYWLDYHHFRETGEVVTGLTYQAFPWGPVPETLYEELRRGRGHIANHFKIDGPKQVSTAAEFVIRTLDDNDEEFGGRASVTSTSRNIPTRISPRAPYSHRFLTKREQRIAAHLAEIFRDVTAEQISDISHVRGGPWSQALKEHGERATIDFLGKLFAMTKGNYLDDEELRRRVAEIEADKANFS